MYYYTIGNLATFGVGGSSLQERCTHTMHLAQQLLADCNYLAHFNKVRKQHPSQIVIIDNGAHELGESIDDTELLALLKETRPNIAVLPDIVGSASRNSALRSTNFWERMFKIKELRQTTPMFVPQGLDKHDVLDSYAWALSHLPTSFMIGFGQAYLKFCAAPWERNSEIPRVELVSQVMRMPGAAKYKFHVLGGRWTGCNYYTMYPNIVGIDSIKPLHCAIRNTCYPDRPDGKPDVLGRQGPVMSSWINNIHLFCDTYGAVWPEPLEFTIPV